MDLSGELNKDLHRDVLDSKTLAISDVLGGGAVASVVDIGTSIWNSLPMTEEVSTNQVLKNIAADSALRVYEEAPDAVHTASFIGGMFLPMGAASKGMQAMRAGTKGVSWFANSERTAEIANAAKMWEEAAMNTSLYKETVRGIYAKTAVNQAIDAVAMEAALLGMYNAHPFMEDYQKDLTTNFTLGALMGGALGAGVGVIADRFAIKGAIGLVDRGIF
jgi:hypothetical protein